MNHQEKYSQREMSKRNFAIGVLYLFFYHIFNFLCHKTKSVKEGLFVSSCCHLNQAMMAPKQLETLAAAATVNVATVAIVAAVVVLGHCEMQSHIWSSVTSDRASIICCRS